MNWFLFWLFLHVLAAVIAFGPIFVFPIVGTLAAQMPQHLRFALELNHRIEVRLVIPLALTMLVSGVGLIWTANINVFLTVYLLVSIGLYLLAMAISIGVLLPTTRPTRADVGRRRTSMPVRRHRRCWGWFAAIRCSAA